MNIHGVGVDIVSIERIAGVLARYQESFARRILSESEIEEFDSAPNKNAFMAKRFAAKEAVFKALGTGLANGLSFKDVVIGHEANGKPIVLLGDKALSIMNVDSAQVWLSISDENRYAVGYALITTG